MIVHYAICDHCGQQNEINKETRAFQASLKVHDLTHHNFNDSFTNQWASSTKKDSKSASGFVDFINLTFCDKECFVYYLNERMTENGQISLTQEELKSLEEKEPSEIQSLKKALKTLENMAGGIDVP